MVVRGANQLNRSRHRLQEPLNPAIIMLRGPHLVIERPATVLPNLRNIDFSRGPMVLSIPFPRNIAWPSR